MSRARIAAALALASFLGLLAPAAHATNGYFAHGYGTASKGIAGAGVALPQDALAAADNPAGMVVVGRRFDLGFALFQPNRSYTVVGNPTGAPGTFGLAPGRVESGSDLFVIPHFGANWTIGDDGSFGVSLFGNGGMNTDYAAATYSGASPTGVDLAQLFVAPTYARKLGRDGRHAVGLSAIVAAQRFEIRGTEAFGPFSADPAHVSNQGYDLSLGIGWKVGYLARPSPRFSLGATYQGRIDMQRFDSYAGIFADGGDFDIPATAAVGIAFRPGARVVVAIDVGRIGYGEVRSIGNPLLPNLLAAQLGTPDGAGFGWKDMTFAKAGLVIETSGPWTFRFGVSGGNQPIRESEVFPNIVAPAVVESHYTFGLSRRTKGGSAVHLALMRAPGRRTVGPNPLEAPGAQRIELRMDQWEVDLGFSWGR